VQPVNPLVTNHPTASKVNDFNPFSIRILEDKQRETVGPPGAKTRLFAGPARARPIGRGLANIARFVTVKTKRWNDPRAPDDGFRVLIARFRPRGVTKARETWDAWWPELGPSRGLHAAVYGKSGPPLPFHEYRPRYFDEMRGQVLRIRALADRAAAGEVITLLCSSACTDPAVCHRTLLKNLIDAAGARTR
jgi:uncharacterized protein YeaO (DUF488 family)